jgi:molecular chaperone DnaK
MKIIGIDLGTTNSVICEYRRGSTQTIAVEGGDTVTPSVVYIDGDVITVGKPAKNRLLINSEKCLSSTKRHIGSNWSKEIGGKNYTPIDAATMVLEYLKPAAEGAKDVVVTIPAYFTEEQRSDTLKAAEKAGFNVLRLLPEPTAAAVCYGFEKEKDQTILVIDLGGGTFDVSLLEVKNNDFTVKAVDGNHQLGGDDFDMAIVKHINQWVESNLGADKAAVAMANPTTQQKFKEAAEQAKIELAELKKADITIFGAVDGQDVEITDFTRTKFQELIQEHLNEVVAKTQSVIDQSGLTLDDINRVVLVGGSCKHPIVQETIKKHFKTPYMAPNMDTAVAEGAAIVCGSLLALRDGSEGTETSVKDAISHSLGTVFQNPDTGFGPDKLIFSPILKKNMNYPCKGAVLGYPVHKNQMAVKFEARRGESFNPAENTLKGSLTLQLPSGISDARLVPVAAVFELDNNGILKLTGIYMPITENNQEDIGRLAKIDNSDSVGIFEELYPLITKYGFTTKEIEIKLDDV